MENKGGREIRGHISHQQIPPPSPKKNENKKWKTTKYLVWCPLGIVILGSLANGVNLTFVFVIRYMVAVVADHSRCLCCHEIGKNMKNSIMHSYRKWVIITTASYEYFWLILKTG